MPWIIRSAPLLTKLQLALLLFVAACCYRDEAPNPHFKNETYFWFEKKPTPDRPMFCAIMFVDSSKRWHVIKSVFHKPMILKLFTAKADAEAWIEERCPTKEK